MWKMDRKSILLVGIAFILLIISVVGLYFNKDNYIKSDEVLITEYKFGTDTIIKQLSVNSKKDINKLTKNISKLKLLKDKKKVNSSLASEVVIKYNDSITVEIQLSERKYCNYINKKKNISGISKLPDELYDYVADKLKNEVDVVEYVNASINKLVNSEEFYKMSEDVRKKKCEALLSRLKRSGKINNYNYSNSNKIYSFEYVNGVVGGIPIKIWNSN